MTPEQLEAQSRAAIKAWCDDPSVQLEVKNKSHDGWFMLNVKAFDLDCAYYRIAKPRKFYRVCLDKNGSLITVFQESQERLFENSAWFDRWLDERRYYD